MKYYCKICGLKIDELENEMLEGHCLDCHKQNNEKRKLIKKYLQNS